MTPAEPLYLAILIFTGAFIGIVSGLLGIGEALMSVSSTDSCRKPDCSLTWR